MLDIAVQKAYNKSVVDDTLRIGGENMNAAKLNYQMEIRNISISEMCKQLNISRSAFYRKREGKTEFTLSEIKRIITLLKSKAANDPAEDNEILSIFFEKQVS